MGAYNSLIVTVNCPDCGNTYEAQIQFKYGDTWQLQYRLGDKLTWGGNDIGVPDWPLVKANGILETDICPICNQVNLEDEFDIYIEHDVLKDLRKMENIEDYILTDGNYKLIE